MSSPLEIRARNVDILRVQIWKSRIMKAPDFAAAKDQEHLSKKMQQVRRCLSATICRATAANSPFIEN